MDVLFPDLLIKDIARFKAVLDQTWEFDATSKRNWIINNCFSKRFCEIIWEITRKSSIWKKLSYIFK